MTTEQEALEYHQSPLPGKLEIKPTKSCLTQRDLSLSYTLGVAAPAARSNPSPYRPTSTRLEAT